MTEQASGGSKTRAEEEGAWSSGVRPGKGHDPSAFPRQPTTEGRHTLVRMGFPDALSSLEGMEGIGEVHVWVRLVHESIQHVHSFQDSHFLVGEAPKLGVLGQEGEVSMAMGLAGSGPSPSPSIHLAWGGGGWRQRKLPSTFFLTKSTVCCVCICLYVAKTRSRSGPDCKPEGQPGGSPIPALHTHCAGLPRLAPKV